MLKRAEEYYRKSSITPRVICFILTIKSDKNNIPHIKYVYFI